MNFLILFFEVYDAVSKQRCTALKMPNTVSKQRCTVLKQFSTVLKKPYTVSKQFYTVSMKSYTVSKQSYSTVKLLRNGEQLLQWGVQSLHGDDKSLLNHLIT
jgi:hypothetical protein